MLALSIKGNIMSHYTDATDCLANEFIGRLSFYEMTVDGKERINVIDLVMPLPQLKNIAQLIIKTLQQLDEIQEKKRNDDAKGVY
jgi:hypothetical protein